MTPKRSERTGSVVTMKVLIKHSDNKSPAGSQDIPITGVDKML